MAYKQPDQEAAKATQFKPGQSGNPNGVPKGTKHINTYIQELMSDETFEASILDAKNGIREYKGAPVKAIVAVAIVKAVNGDPKAMDWLAKYGWSQKIEQDITSNGESIGMSNTQIEQLIRARADRKQDTA